MARISGEGGFVFDLSGLGREPFPEWAWLLFVLGIDVAHVYATLFRTYLDPDELRQHPVRYALAPLSVFGLGCGLYAVSSLWFWRCFAYIAVYHFIRQQVGWVAIYRAKSRHRGKLDRAIDEAAVYSATLYPLAYWHAHLASTHFAWFVQGDFVDVTALAGRLLPGFQLAFWLSLGVFLVRQGIVLVRERVVLLGKLCVVLSTAAIWYVGIIATNSDFAFTVTNVIVHGVPYVALLWMYTKARARECPRGLLVELRKKGLAVFLVCLVALAFAEELLWEHLVFHDRPWLFGESAVWLSPAVLTFVVPLLMVPQATHYVLDGLLWRSKDTRALSAQRRALGIFAPGERNS